MNIYEQFPDREQLLREWEAEDAGPILKVNNHIHSPYSFSAFSGIGEAVRLAADEGVKILGINDFYVADGFGEFVDRCLDQGVFPLLNVEMIGISREEQQAGIRVNDPNNPGRTYISGKGFPFPFRLPADRQQRLDSVVEESNRQVSAMVKLLNRWLAARGTGLSLSVEEIMDTLAHRLLRERHVAKILRLKLEAAAHSDAEYDALLRKVYGGQAAASGRADVAGTENELRSRLLKAGAPAFVPEDERAFLPLDEIIEMIRAAGGIPTYPLLLDGTGDAITEFEDGKKQLLGVLEQKGIPSVEFIPLRNRIGILKEYAEFFYANGFTVSFGTEHNTSARGPLTVSCRDRVPLDERLMEISFKGAAYIAAHQYLASREGPGYRTGTREEMESLGQALFRHYFHTFNPSFRKTKQADHGSKTKTDR
jgi:hypothetical protein